MPVKSLRKRSAKSAVRRPSRRKAMPKLKHEYRVVYTPIEDGWYLAQAPELPGAITQGRTLREARAMIRDAVELLLECYRENAEKDAPGNAIWETLSVGVPVK